LRQKSDGSLERVSRTPSLPESSAVLRALAGAVSDVIVVLDRDGRYLDVVSRRADLLVRPADELLGQTIHDVFPTEAADRFLGWIRQVLETRCNVEDECEVDIAGRRTWFASIVAPLGETSVIWASRGRRRPRLQQSPDGHLDERGPRARRPREPQRRSRGAGADQARV
jgi:PAS domain S-box-containing protein